MGGDTALLLTAIGEGSRYVHAPYIARNHVLKRCAPPYDDASHAELSRHVDGGVEITLIRLVKHVSLGVACRGDEAPAIVDRYGIGKQGVACACALALDVAVDVVLVVPLYGVALFVGLVEVE